MRPLGDMRRSLACPISRTLLRFFALFFVLSVAACSRGTAEKEPRTTPASQLSAGLGGRSSEDTSLGTALSLGADEVANRLGSFEWTGEVEWTVSSSAPDAHPIHLKEHHRVREISTGEFEVDAQTDPGTGTGSTLGKHVLYAGGMTYARGEYAPFRERPTDHGRDARRFRDESFTVASDVARLTGDALIATPAGEGTVLGRRANRLKLSLDASKFRPPPSVRPDSAAAPDDDTIRRLAFLDGHVPRRLDGEVFLDADTGVPLRTKLSATFGTTAQPTVKVELNLFAQMRTLGGAVAAVTPPPNPLPDSRKPKGVAAALESAGLKTRAQEEADKKAEPEDEDTGP